MNTIFDTLNSPRFREFPQLYIGSRDIFTLEAWMQGYVCACYDADEQTRINTPNGIPFSLFRDYIALMEQDQSTGGIAHILMKAAGGQNEEALTRFFSHLDNFTSIKTRNVWRMQITDSMRLFASKLNNSYELEQGGNLVPRDFKTNALKKVTLANGLCWITEERIDGDRIWTEFHYSILPEDKADELLLEKFGNVKWEQITTNL